MQKARQGDRQEKNLDEVRASALQLIFHIF